VSVGLKRGLVVAGILVALVLAGAYLALTQLVSLQPPITEANVIERRRARAYRETVTITPITARTRLEVGQAAVFRAGSTGRVVVLLPDSGTGAWSFEPYLTLISASRRLYAASYRGMIGARPTQGASFNDYVQDAREAILKARADAGTDRVVLLGQGLGALIAMKLSQTDPNLLEGIVLLAPFVPREWSDMQRWLVGVTGTAFYHDIWNNPERERGFWRDYFPAAFVQKNLAEQYLTRYADQKIPYEFPGVTKEVTLGPISWLEGAFDGLEKLKLPVLHIAARYDVANPASAQQRLKLDLEARLHKRYFFSALNSGRLISLDWKWKESAALISDFLDDLRLDQPLIEREEPLDPATENDPLNQDR
jgi:pimeloyl-ACP methyl ester carboxylesterase